MRVIGWPTISSAEYPKIRSALWFQLKTMPSRSLPMMASPDDSMMAASRARVSSACLRSVMSEKMPGRGFLQRLLGRINQCSHLSTRTSFVVKNGSKNCLEIFLGYGTPSVADLNYDFIPGRALNRKPQLALSSRSIDGVGNQVREIVTSPAVRYSRSTWISASCSLGRNTAHTSSRSSEILVTTGSLVSRCGARVWRTMVVSRATS